MAKTTSGYVPIHTKKASQPENLMDKINNEAEEDNSEDDIEEVTLDEIVDEPKDIEYDLKKNKVVSEDDDDAEEDEEKEDTKKKEEKSEKKFTPVSEEKDDKKKDDKPSRAKKRIQQLHSEKTELQKQLERERKEKELLMAQMDDSSFEQKQVLQKQLEDNISTLTKGLREAMEDGNSDDAVKYNEDLINAKMQLAGVTSEVNRLSKDKEFKKVEAEKQRQQPQQNKPQLHNRALEWIDENPEFNTDQLFFVNAVTISQQLEQEGYDDTDDDFYRELENRLAPIFPKKFGNNSTNSVQYEEEDVKSSNDEDEDVKEESPKATRQMEQTVSGASRTPPHKKGKSSRGRDSVVLDPATVKQAERWGLSLEQIARRQAHNTKNRRDDGYVPITIKKT